MVKTLRDLEEDLTDIGLRSALKDRGSVIQSILDGSAFTSVPHWDVVIGLIDPVDYLLGTILANVDPVDKDADLINGDLVIPLEYVDVIREQLEGTLTGRLRQRRD